MDLVRHSRDKLRRDGIPKKLSPTAGLLQEVGDFGGVDNLKKNYITEGARIVASTLNTEITTLKNEVTDLRRDLNLKPNIKVVKKKSGS